MKPDKENGGRYPADQKGNSISQSKQKLTKAEEMVYFYAFFISKWDSIAKESHNYIYKNTRPTFVKIAEETGLSRVWVGKCWKSLIQKGYMFETNFKGQGVYILPEVSEQMVKIPREKFSGFLAYARNQSGEYKGTITIARLYNLLKYGYLTHPDWYFSGDDIRDIIELDCHYPLSKIVEMLDVLNGNDFMRIEKKKYKNNLREVIWGYRCIDLLEGEKQTYSDRITSCGNILTEEERNECKEKSQK